MVHQWFFFLLLFMMSGLVPAQDERYYRQILSGELPKAVDEEGEVVIAPFTLYGPSYRLDLDGDKIEEIIQPQKREGVDWIEIKSSSQRSLFASQLLAMGAWSEIYKIKFVTLSSKLKALIVFLDEGVTQGKRFESTGRFYVISWENNDLTKISIAVGPHFFHEKQSMREQYWRRSYNVLVHDINGDGIKEIAIMYNHIQRIMIYKGFGEWSRF